MKIKTNRLILYPLNPEQLKKLIEDVNILEEELNIKYKGEPVEGIFGEIMRNQLARCNNDRENYLWNSFWLLILKKDRVVVGSIGFKGKPNNKGEVEIGYGLGKEFQHNGYMTEGVKAICKWAFEKDNISIITAETDFDNFPSQRILQRCGFEKIEEKNIIRWKLKK
jgi:RimJ/RimL family protein N-acetyltransferase